MAHELNPPLIHLIRNAFDHGIETREVRLEKGKETAGVIRLSVTRSGNFLALALSDDGAGLDCGRIRDRAAETGLLSAEKAHALSRQECIDLIFKSGFSTKGTVTEVSGRGVGLDTVLDSVIKKMNGEITVESETGKGTVFTLRVPCPAGTRRGD